MKFGPQKIYSELHRLLMQSKLCHYKTKSYAQHEAFGRIYDALGGLIDGITEKLIGYSSEDPENLALGTITVVSLTELADSIMSTGKKIQDFANAKSYLDIENLAQEVSGVGAQLKFLSRYP